MAALAARQRGTSLEYVGAAVHQALEPARASVWIKQRYITAGR